MAFEPNKWKSGKDGGTPISADDLNRIEEAGAAKAAKGDPGADGKDGAAGKDGADGKSAFQLAADAGFGGTETEWLDSLKGADGKDGSNGKDGADGKDAVAQFTDAEVAALKALAGAEG